MQEPKTQAMRVQMFDHDVLNLKVVASPAPHPLGRPAQQPSPTNAWVISAHPSAFTLELSGACRAGSRHVRSMCHLL